jgi:hypothetical protein
VPGDPDPTIIIPLPPVVDVPDPDDDVEVVEVLFYCPDWLD